nr:immunoglobulin heavy chain junction region [Mus musculus]
CARLTTVVARYFDVW